MTKYFKRVYFFLFKINYHHASDSHNVRIKQFLIQLASASWRWRDAEKTVMMTDCNLDLPQNQGHIQAWYIFMNEGKNFP